MNVGFVQFCPVHNDIPANLHRVSKMLESVTADVIVLPELFATGYLFADAAQIRQIAEPSGSGQIYNAMRDWAKRHDALIMGGFPESDGDFLYNSSIAIEPDGKFHLYRKIHLFDREKLIFAPGNMPLQPFTFRGVKFGQLICFDWIFPESHRTLAMRGAQVILHCANLVLPYCQKASFARAIENRIFIIVANRIGTETLGDIELHFTGGSIIYAPDGEILAHAGDKENAAMVARISPEKALDKWVTERNHLFNDRRMDFYYIA